MRITDVMSAERHQLVMAEYMMFNVSNEVFVEGRFAYGLWYGEPQIRRIWQAIGQYNRFFAENEQYYVGAKSLASLAIVLDNRSDGDSLLNALAGRRLLFHILYEHELTPERLKPYAAVVLLTADLVRDSALAALEKYVESGGKLFAAPQSAAHDEDSHPRPRPAWFGTKLGQGEAVSWDRLPPMDHLAATLRAADRPPPVRIEAPAGVLYNVTRQAAARRLIVHLINYVPRPTGRVMVAVEGHYERVTLLTPDSPRDPPRTVRAADNLTEIEIPRLGTYALLVFTER
jgi:hypothetical protein